MGAIGKYYFTQLGKKIYFHKYQLEKGNILIPNPKVIDSLSSINYFLIRILNNSKISPKMKNIENINNVGSIFIESRKM